MEEENVWGKTGEDEYLGKYPPGLTPTIEHDELPNGVLGESCAVMMYLASRDGRDDLYPTDLKRRAMVDAANFYTLSILYPGPHARDLSAPAVPGLPGGGVDLGGVRRSQRGRPQVG